MPIDSGALKTAALAFLRYGKRLPICCTEVGRWNADVLGVSPTMAIEIETKVSKADMKADFKKTAKHYTYAHAKDTSYAPNFFYFLLPEDLADAAVSVVETNAPKAGVLAYHPEAGDRYTRESVTVVRRAVRLKDSPPSKVMLQQAMARCSSELCGLYQWNQVFGKKLLAAAENSRLDIVRLAARAAGTLDCEQPMEDLELRAQELAYCVEGLDARAFAALDISQKEKWLEAAVKWLDAQYVNAKGWVEEPFLF